MKRPSFFFSSDCGCSGGGAPNYPRGYGQPCDPGTPASICDGRYSTLSNSANVKLLAVAPGTTCQTFLTSPVAGGFVVPDGIGVGFKVVQQPTQALPTQALATGSPLVPQTIPFLLGALGSSPTTPWVELPPPPSGTWFLTATTGGWTLTDATNFPGLSPIFSAATGTTSIEVMGFVQSGSTFIPRKLVGSGTLDVPLVLHFNSTTGRYEVTPAATASPTAFNQIATISLFETGTGSAGAPGPFTVRPNINGGTFHTADACDFLMLDNTTGQLYYPPGPTYANQTSTSNSASMTVGTPLQIVDFGTLGLNYGTVLCAWQVKTNLSDHPVIQLLIDGTVAATWDYSTDSGLDDRIFSGTKVITGLSFGNHAMTMQFTTNNSGGQVVGYYNADIITLR